MSHPGRRPHPRVDLEISDGVAVVTIDDGKVNALSERMTRAASEALDDLEAGNATAVVLAGRPHQFCAGFDLDTLAIGGPPRDRLVLDGWNLLLRVLTFPLPVVVACTGNAVAGGAGMLLTGDVRLGAEGPYRIGFNEAAIGLPLPGVVLMLVADRLREDVIDEATRGARLYRPDEAVGAGFLHRVEPPDDLLDAAVAEARSLGASQAFQRAKRARVDPLVARMRQQLNEDITLLQHIGA